jgi:hypothetical protein
VLTGGEMPIAWRSLALTTFTTLKIVEALKNGKPEIIKFEI